ncbi:MAG: hypothetical protein HY823_01500 [Acidobacteria bacterium]|nr:hypothetical protein [Acidobacteriota bacterium]
MKRRFPRHAIPIGSLVLCWTPGAAQVRERIPANAGDWKPAEAPGVYDSRTVYDYMDGGAELYLSYGMNALGVQVYTKAGAPAITLNLFEMQSAPGAYGVFTYERLDGDAGIGQGSEYASGILRFWQGRHFVFMQALEEAPGVKEAMFALGRDVAARLGPGSPLPRLPSALPPEGLRPLTVRYLLGRQLIEALEAFAVDNALVLPVRCEAVLGRYGHPGRGERILIVKYPDLPAAKKGLESFLTPRAGLPGRPFKGPEGWSVAGLAEDFAILVLGAETPTLATRQFETTARRLQEVLR